MTLGEPLPLPFFCCQVQQVTSMLGGYHTRLAQPEAHLSQVRWAELRPPPTHPPNPLASGRYPGGPGSSDTGPQVWGWESLWGHFRSPYLVHTHWQPLVRAGRLCPPHHGHPPRFQEGRGWAWVQPSHKRAEGGALEK